MNSSTAKLSQSRKDSPAYTVINKAGLDDEDHDLYLEIAKSGPDGIRLDRAGIYTMSKLLKKNLANLSVNRLKEALENLSDKDLIKNEGENYMANFATAKAKKEAELKKELHKMGLKTYKSNKVEGSFVRKSEVKEILAKLDLKKSKS